MLDLSLPELGVIGLIALVVLGPERLPKVARFVGLWVRRARAQWYSVKGELERELEAEELKRSLHKVRDEADDIGAQVRAAGDETRKDFESMREALQEARRSRPAEVRIGALVDDSDLAGSSGQDIDLPSHTPDTLLVTVDDTIPQDTPAPAQESNDDGRR